MDHDDRRAIDALFDKIETAAQGGASRDPEAERYIAERAARVPGAAYLMAQTIVVQEQALAAAQAEPARREEGGFLSNLFGGGDRPRARPMPRQGRGGPWERQGGMGGGGFLAGAAQTAMGIGGGVLLANAVGGLFDGGDGGDSADAGGGDFGDGGGGE